MHLAFLLFCGLSDYWWRGVAESGADPGFVFRGRKRLCARVHAHQEREARSSLRPGSRAHLMTLKALGVFDALSCYLSLI